MFGNRWGKIAQLANRTEHWVKKHWRKVVSAEGAEKMSYSEMKEMAKKTIEKCERAEFSLGYTILKRQEIKSPYVETCERSTTDELPKFNLCFDIEKTTRKKEENLMPRMLFNECSLAEGNVSSYEDKSITKGAQEEAGLYQLDTDCVELNLLNFQEDSPCV